MKLLKIAFFISIFFHFRISVYATNPAPVAKLFQTILAKTGDQGLSLVKTLIANNPKYYGLSASKASLIASFSTADDLLRVLPESHGGAKLLADLMIHKDFKDQHRRKFDELASVRRFLYNELALNRSIIAEVQSRAFSQSVANIMLTYRRQHGVYSTEQEWKFISKQADNYGQLYNHFKRFGKGEKAAEVEGRFIHYLIESISHGQQARPGHRSKSLGRWWKHDERIDFHNAWLSQEYKKAGLGPKHKLYSGTGLTSKVFKDLSWRTIDISPSMTAEDMIVLATAMEQFTNTEGQSLASLLLRTAGYDDDNVRTVLKKIKLGTIWEENEDFTGISFLVGRIKTGEEKALAAVVVGNRKNSEDKAITAIFGRGPGWLFEDGHRAIATKKIQELVADKQYSSQLSTIISIEKYLDDMTTLSTLSARILSGSQLSSSDLITLWGVPSWSRYLRLMGGAYGVPMYRILVSLRKQRSEYHDILTVFNDKKTPKNVTYSGDNAQAHKYLLINTDKKISPQVSTITSPFLSELGRPGFNPQNLYMISPKTFDGHRLIEVTSIKEFTAYLPNKSSGDIIFRNRIDVSFSNLYFGQEHIGNITVDASGFYRLKLPDVFIGDLVIHHPRFAPSKLTLEPGLIHRGNIIIKSNRDEFDVSQVPLADEFEGEVLYQKE